MSVSGVPMPRLVRTLRGWADGWNRIGEQTAFYIRGIGSVKDAVIYYREETIRVIAQMSLGVGALALIGGALVIVVFIMANIGFLVPSWGIAKRPTSGWRPWLAFSLLPLAKETVHGVRKQLGRARVRMGRTTLRTGPTSAGARTYAGSSDSRRVALQQCLRGRPSMERDIGGRSSAVRPGEERFL